MNEFRYMNELITRYPALCECQADIQKTYEILLNCFQSGGKLLVAGNGGSCADAEHIVGELMKGFVKRRPVSGGFVEKLKKTDLERGQVLADKLQTGLPAIALTGHPGLSTAFLNDVDGTLIYAQQLFGYGSKNDVFLGISTSGNSKNILYAVTTAKAMGMQVLGLTGKQGGELGKLADAAVKVPETETYKIQELHLPVYHVLCLMLEEYFFQL